MGPIRVPILSTEKDIASCTCDVLLILQLL